MTRHTPPSRKSQLDPHPHHHHHPLAASSVSSPSVPHSDCAEVDELLEGIDRVRIDDLWTTPRAADNHVAHDSAPFRAGLFAPPHASAIAPIVPPDAVPPSASLVAAFSAPQHDFPAMFKVHPCPTRDACLARADTAECFYYHSHQLDRRRPNVAIYKPHMCRFVEEAGGCRKGDRCPFSHNDFERRYHPDRFGKETCRDFLRGDCPRRYCTFRHEVSGKVEVALAQMDAMNDKELLQLVLKIGEQKGRAFSEKLLRRFGHGKKHSGWRLEGFHPHGREDQKVKFVTARIEEVKRQLRVAGEKKWAASLKTSSLRDMMSGVRKVAEEMRERCRADECYVENGSDVHRLIRAVFSNTNWSCHSQEGDNPFLVTPENQNDAVSAIEKLVELMLAANESGRPANKAVVRKKKTGASQCVDMRHPLSDVNVRSDESSDMSSSLWAYSSTIGGLTV